MGLVSKKTHINNKVLYGEELNATHSNTGMR